MAVNCRAWTTGLLVALGLGPLPARAQQLISPKAMAQIEALLAEKTARTPVQRRIDSQLLAAYRMKQGQAVAQGMTSLPGVWEHVKLLKGDVVLVDIKADVSPALLASLAGLGVAVESSFPRYQAIRARLPIGLVERVAGLPGVLLVEPAQEARTNTGAVTSEGDAAHKAPQARALGLTGAGVKIGVLSDGVTSLATSIGTGDLPAGLTVLAGQAGSGDEGTAMLEIVYDLAPSAQLYYATAFNGVASFATNVQALQAAGCNVIVDDVTYFNEGAFQDGPIAQAVNAVTAAGALYFSSAANSGNLTSGTSGTWEGDFAASTYTINYSRGSAAVHDFGGNQVFNTLTVGTHYVTLKWSDALGASANDYDLFVFDSGQNLLASSTTAQTGAQDPYEIVSNTVTGFPAGSLIVVAKFSGASRALRIDTNRGRLAFRTAGSTFGHNAAESAITLAASDARLPGAGNPFVGGVANPIESYSSDGPRRMFFSPNGSAITPGNVLFGTGGGRVLQKPDITAADCVKTTVSGFTTFCGTSAAAPHAAAIAGLLLSASPAPAPALVRATMTGTALDIMASGVDRDSGRGIAMADRSAAGADLAVTLLGPAGVATGTNAVYTITVTNNGIGSAASVQVLDATPSGFLFVSNAGACTTMFPCALGSLAAGATRSITTTFAVPPLYAGPNPVLNSASVTTTSTDPVSSNDSATASTTITGVTAADLAITKAGPAAVAPGGNLVYTITVTNHGPASASSVQVADVTPPGLTFVSNSGACATAFPCSLGTLASGAQLTITSTYSVPVSYSGGSPIVNTATVSSGSGDPDATNNAAAAGTWLSAAYYTLTPCRLADTRDSGRPAGYGPPPLQPLQERTFRLAGAGACGVPVGASAVALNVTITQGTALGDLRLFPADAATPLVSTINFSAGQTRANNAVVVGSFDGTVSIKVRNDSAGPVDLILDVTGYFK